MFTINNRSCRLGNSMSNNTEKHGDDDVHSAAFKIDGLMLDPEELNSLLMDPKAHKQLFVKRDKVDEPLLSKCDPLKYKQEFEGATVTLILGGLSREELLLEDCRFKDIEIEPMTGGLSRMSVKVLCCPDSEEQAKVFDWLNKEIEAELWFGSAKEEKAKKKQRDLPLSTVGDNEDDREHAATAH